ncbi:MAG: tRNA dihydrouridine(20/20a) synthase DusA [Nanoarchaeota archaeon]
MNKDPYPKTMLETKRSIDMAKLSIAPMVDRTDRHFRHMMRLFSKDILLYTEMITAPAIIHGDYKKLLSFGPCEKPLVLQIAGSDPEEMAQAVEIAEQYDYDEINLNAGCPSDKVSEYKMGASLMADAELVADLVKAMKSRTKKPVSVKCRLGIDGRKVIEGEKQVFDTYDDLRHFISTVEKAGVARFTIHARIAILAGLDPKKNRSIPELKYDQVYQIKKDFPHLDIEINGGIKTKEAIIKQLQKVDRVMLGRIAYEDPMVLAELAGTDITREEIIEQMIDYIKVQERKGEKVTSILMHLAGLYHGQPGSKKWKQLILPPWDNDKTASAILEEGLDVMRKRK